MRYKGSCLYLFRGLNNDRMSTRKPLQKSAIRAKPLRHTKKWGAHSVKFVWAYGFDGMRTSY